MDIEDFEHFFALMRPRLMRTALRSLDVDSANEVAVAALHTIWTKNLPAPRDHSSESSRPCADADADADAVLDHEVDQLFAFDQHDTHPSPFELALSA